MSRDIFYRYGFSYCCRSLSCKMLENRLNSIMGDYCCSAVVEPFSNSRLHKGVGGCNERPMSSQWPRAHNGRGARDPKFRTFALIC